MSIDRRSLLTHTAGASPTAVMPGFATLFHCHQQLHMDFGFTAMINYA